MRKPLMFLTRLPVDLSERKTMMAIFLFLLIFVYALPIASFFNVVAMRIPKGKSIIYPPSHCSHCHHRLTALDLFPIFSYLFLSGKCRYCHTKISAYYPLGELITSLVMSGTVMSIGWSAELWIAIPLVCLFAAISISDLLYRIIPNKINAFGFIYFFLARCFYHPSPFYHYLLGIAAGGGLLFLLAIISRGGMGGGDIKLMSVVGLALGWKLTLLALFMASLFASLIAGGLLLFKVLKRKEPIPFGPFLAIGSLVSYLWGAEWISIYIHWVMAISR